MDGDRADLAALRALADRHDAFLYLDEAHATGVLGPRGMGLSGAVAGGVDLAMGTFSKALGGFGAYVAGSRALCDWLVNRASGFIHTTALPPPVLGAIDAALDLVPSMDAERARLAAPCRTGCAPRLPASASTTAPPPRRSCRPSWASAGGARPGRPPACARGVLAVAIRPPTVPAGTSRLRLALSAAHTDGRSGPPDRRPGRVPGRRRRRPPEPCAPGVFVTGTDTGIGKTVVCACLVRRWAAAYWKPVQTGLAHETGRQRTSWPAGRRAAGRIHRRATACGAALARSRRRCGRHHASRSPISPCRTATRPSWWKAPAACWCRWAAAPRWPT